MTQLGAKLGMHRLKDAQSDPTNPTGWGLSLVGRASRLVSRSAVLRLPLKPVNDHSEQRLDRLLALLLGIRGLVSGWVSVSRST
nr:hypothetical protein GCM10020063_008810 [Dactylosporangium thailandense]